MGSVDAYAVCKSVKLKIKINYHEPGIEMHICNPNIRDAKVEWLQVQGSLSYVVSSRSA